MITINDFILFLKHPKIEEQICIISFISFLKLVWKSFLILVLIDVVIGLVVAFPLRYFDLFPSQKEFNPSLNNLIKVSVILPIVEELIFRLPLKVNKVNFSLAFCVSLFVLINRLDRYLGVVLPIIIFGFLLLFLKDESKFLRKADSIVIKYFYLLFYSQALIFGLLHLKNFNLNFNLFFLFPLFIIGHIIAGCFFGYIRIKYFFGIYICITSHVLINSIYCFLLYH
jgi:hypothetical protein